MLVIHRILQPAAGGRNGWRELRQRRRGVGPRWRRRPGVQTVVERALPSPAGAAACQHCCGRRTGRKAPRRSATPVRKPAGSHSPSLAVSWPWPADQAQKGAQRQAASSRPNTAQAGLVAPLAMLMLPATTRGRGSVQPGEQRRLVAGEAGSGEAAAVAVAPAGAAWHSERLPPPPLPLLLKQQAGRIAEQALA